MIHVVHRNFRNKWCLTPKELSYWTYFHNNHGTSPAVKNISNANDIPKLQVTICIFVDIHTYQTMFTLSFCARSRSFSQETLILRQHRFICARHIDGSPPWFWMAEIRSDHARLYKPVQHTTYSMHTSWKVAHPSRAGTIKHMYKKRKTKQDKHQEGANNSRAKWITKTMTDMETHHIEI